MHDYVALVIGVVCAGIGGEFFVRGSVGLARGARISAAIVGATVAAFATSSPELAVAIGSAVAGNPEISLGDALGSNVINVALILGLSLTIAGIQSPRSSVKRDFPMALMVPFVIGLLSLDGELSHVDGFVLYGLFIGWFAAVLIEARQQRKVSDDAPVGPTLWRAVLLCIVALVLLALAGRLIVIGARGIALSFGWDEFVVGAIVVAFGTSVPELATVVIAKLRGHDEVGLGTILGSNIFNGLWIVPTAAVIHPITISRLELAEVLGFGIVAMALTYPATNGYIGRVRGVLLLALYVFYTAAILYH
jgi:cation:H+ antiporter